MTIVSHVSQPELVAVASGHAAPGQSYEVEISPNYLAFQDRVQGALLYRRCQPIEACENEDQRQGWRDERADERGRAAYLRALEEEGCPASWADPYMPKPSGIVTDW